MRWLKLFLVSFVILSVARWNTAGQPASALAAPLPQSADSLENGSFEGAFDPWKTWAVVQGSDCTYQQPDFDIITLFGEDPLHVLDGHDAGRLSIDDKRSYWAGVYQEIRHVTPGTILEFSIEGQMDSNLGTDSTPTNYEGQANMRAGIDPTGGTSPSSSNIIWSPTETRFDSYYKLTVRATAQSDHVTVFFSSNPSACNNSNFTYFDRAQLSQEGLGPTPTTSVPATATSVPPTAGPTSAPSNTAAPTSASTQSQGPTTGPLLTPTPGEDGVVIYTVQSGDTLTAIAAAAGLTIQQVQALNGLSDTNIIIGQKLIIATALPTETPTIAPTDTAAPSATLPPEPTATPAPQTGTVCVALYSDDDGDGARAASETWLGGGNLQLVDSANHVIIAEYRTSATNAPHCFTDLNPATYMVIAAVPEGYTLTGSPEVGVLLPPQGEVTVEFGAQPARAASNSTVPIAAGVGVTLVGVAAAGVVLYRRRARPPSNF